MFIIEGIFTHDGINKRIAIDSRSSNQINDSISKYKYVTRGRMIIFIIFDHKQLHAL